MIKVRGATRHLVVMAIAISLLAGCNKSDKDDQDGSVLRAADRMRASGNPTGAIAIYRRVLEKTPNDADKLPIYLNLGDALIENGQLNEASKVFEQALEIDRDFQAKKRLARCYLLAGKPNPVIKICNEIIAANDKDAEAYNALGVAYDLKADRKRAQESYNMALSISPNDPNIQGNLGLSLAFSGAYEESFKWLVPLGEKIGATPKQRHNLAVAYALSGERNKARVLFAKDLDSQEVEGNMHILKGVQLTKIPRKDIKE
ncbi:MAG: tetratricopeptide repeat protein [Alphaproteobacteria bacterium]